MESGAPWLDPVAGWPDDGRVMAEVNQPRLCSWAFPLAYQGSKPDLPNTVDEESGLTVPLWCRALPSMPRA